MALALDPRYASLASLVALCKKLIVGRRLGHAPRPGDQHTSLEERVRNDVLSTLTRYDNDVTVPMMLALNPSLCGGTPATTTTPSTSNTNTNTTNTTETNTTASTGTTTTSGTGMGTTAANGNGKKEDSESKDEQQATKAEGDDEDGLFPQTLEPGDDWKKRQQLLGELTKFRSLRKNVPKNAPAAACLAWWDANASFFPNIAKVFRLVVSIPTSHAPARRVVSSDGAKLAVARNRLPRARLEDMALIHENFALVEDPPVPPTATLAQLRDALVTGVHDEQLAQLAPALFSAAED